MIRLLLPLLLAPAVLPAQQRAVFYEVKQEQESELLNRLGLSGKYDSIVNPHRYAYAMLYVSTDSLRFDSLGVNGIQFLCSQKSNGTLCPIRICPVTHRYIPFSWLSFHIAEGALLRKMPSSSGSLVYKREETDQHEGVKIIAQKKDRKGNLWLQVNFTATPGSGNGSGTPVFYEGWMLASDVEIQLSAW
jgi:hypothetical protein